MLRKLQSLQQLCAVALLKDDTDDEYALSRIASITPCNACSQTNYDRPYLVTISHIKPRLVRVRRKVIICDTCYYTCPICGDDNDDVSDDIRVLITGRRCHAE